MRKILLATVAVFVVWSALGYVIHGIILGPSYSATASLWRPTGEMKMGLMYLVGLISALTFVVIFGLFFAKKTVFSGLKYGLIFGAGTGISMGYGSYAVLPIPYHMALTWFLGAVIEAAVGGLILGGIMRD
jgi:hypothetical protein